MLEPVAVERLVAPPLLVPYLPAAPYADDARAIVEALGLVLHSTSSFAKQTARGAVLVVRNATFPVG